MGVVLQSKTHVLREVVRNAIVLAYWAVALGSDLYRKRTDLARSVVLKNVVAEWMAVSSVRADQS